MAVSCAINVNNSTPSHGDTVIATYTVDGNDPVPDQGATISARAVIGSVPYNVSTTVTLPGSPALAETFDLPTCPGLTFQATGDPKVFTAVVP